MGVGAGVAVGIGVGFEVGDGTMVGVGDTVGIGLGVGSTVGLGVKFGVGVGVGVASFSTTAFAFTMKVNDTPLCFTLKTRSVVVSPGFKTPSVPKASESDWGSGNVMVSIRSNVVSLSTVKQRGCRKTSLSVMFLNDALISK